jgi:hypothetical protein
VKHTPGPWVVERGHPLMVVAEGGGMAVLVSAEQATTDLDRANANLIAAAPALLRCLESALSCSRNHVECMCWEDIAKSVVKKAKGS